MDTLVSKYCRPVVTVDMYSPVDHLLAKINWDNDPSIVVTDKEKNVIGIITEHDMVYAESIGVKKSDLKAWEICTKNIVKISPDDTVLGASRLMVEHKVHHVLIMTGDYLEGVISTFDVLRELLSTENK